MQDIVSIFSEAAETLEYKFIYGAKAFLNYDVGDEQLTEGQILIALFPLIDQATEIVHGGRIGKFETSTTVWIGRKFDHDQYGGTVSELDETNKQKYDRRLYELKGLVMDYIETTLCGTDIELTSFRMSEYLNQTNENIDFIGCDIRLRHERGYV